MSFELVFVTALFCFAAVALCIRLKHRFAGRALHIGEDFKKRSRFERRHPVLCDRDNTFYCFFKRDVFSR